MTFEIKRHLTDYQHEQGQDRFLKAAKLLEQHGVRPLLWREIDQLATDCQIDLACGLTDGKLPSSFQMIDTKLPAVVNEKLTPGNQALVLEIGGTNLRAAIVEVQKDKTVVIKQDAKKQPIYLQHTLENREFKNVDDFFAQVVLPFADLIKTNNPQAVAIVYSFPGDAKVVDRSLDVISTSLSKNFVVPGLKGKMIGEEFLIQLTKLGILDEDNKPIYVVMNDTPAVLLSCPEAKIGGVVASGFNFAVEIAGRVYNMEAGGFDKVPFHDASEAIDLISENPDKYLAEKQISGIFLGEQFKLIVRALERDGLIISRLKPDITSALINQVLQLDEINMEKIGNLINEPIDSYDLAILQMIANTLRKRSAQIVGTMIGAIISTLKHEIPGKKIQIPIEGPVFWNIPLYRQIVAETANDISGCDIEFIQREHAGIVGAAIAVLARLNQ